MGLSVWRKTSKKLTVYRVCYTPIETLKEMRSLGKGVKVQFTIMWQLNRVSLL